MLTIVKTLDPQLASHLRMSVMRLARRLRQERTTDEHTTSQLSALATLDRRGPLTLAELAAAERVQPPSMHRIVGHLEEAALLTRSAHPTDGRQVLLAATPEGTRLLAADRKRRDAWLHRRLATLDADEVETLRAAADVLERLASE